MIDRPLLSKRLNAAYEYLRSQGAVHTITEFATALGKSQGDISSALAAKGRVMTTGLLQRVYDTFPEYFNKEWLLTGEGEMAKPSREMRPHFEQRVAAGFLDGISKGEYGDDLRPIIPFLRDYDFTIEVRGKSMLPYYREGDILACRISKDRNNPPIGKVCVIDAKGGAVVKEISRVNEQEGTVTCHSYNDAPLYKDYDLEFEDINQIAVVVGSIRAEE